jgi:hypothetical protein
MSGGIFEARKSWKANICGGGWKWDIYIYIWTLWSSSSIGDFRGLVVCGRSNKERDFLVLGRFRVSFGSWSSEEESSYGVLGHRMWFKRKNKKRSPWRVW